MKIVVDREIFHHMMRGIAGGFQHSSMSGANHHRMKLTAEKLAHATAAGELTVEVHIGGPFPPENLELGAGETAPSVERPA